MYVFIGITGLFLTKQGCLFPLNWQEPAPEFVLFQAILTLSPAEAEPLKKTYVKLCDAYGILGNLRLNAGEVRLWSLFRLKLINLLIGCSPLHCPDNRMYIGWEDWPGRGDYHKNTSLSTSPFLSGVQTHGGKDVQPSRLPTGRGESCGDHQVADQWGGIFLLVSPGTKSHNWSHHACPKNAQVKCVWKLCCWWKSFTSADAGSLSSRTTDSSGTACCTSPMWGQESVLQTGW